MVENCCAEAERFATRAIKRSLGLCKWRWSKGAAVRSRRWQGDKSGVTGKIQDIHGKLGRRLGMLVELLQSHPNDGIRHCIVFFAIDSNVVVEMHLEHTTRTAEKCVCSNSILGIIWKVRRVVENKEDLRCPKASEERRVIQSTRVFSD